MKRTYGYLLLAMTAWLAACGDSGQQAAQQQAAEPAPPSEPCKLVMGWDPWMPYQYRAADGSVTGLDIEIASAVAASAGCALATHEGSWMQHLAMLEKGELDLVGGATKTPAREEFGWFTEPYREETFVVFVRAADAGGIQAQDVEALLKQELVIGTVMDYYYGGVVAQLQENPDYEGQFTDAEVSEQNFRRLKEGNIDAVLEDPYVGAAMLRSSGWADEIVEYPIVINTGDVRFMFSRAGVKEDVFTRFNESLANMKNSGALDAILDRYRD